MDNDPTSQDSVETLLKKILSVVSTNGGSGGGNVFTTLQTDILNFGGTSNLFPSLRRDGDILQVKLADDSDFCRVQGKLTTHNQAQMQIPSGITYLTFYDSNGVEFLVEASQVE